MQEFFEIVSNRNIAKNVFEMRLAGDTSRIVRAGQFVNIKIDGFYLRRPISVCDCKDGVLTVVFKTVGSGTQKLSLMHCGEKLDLLTGLGNGYDVEKCGKKTLVVGGGVGVPPMYMLTKKLIENGKKPTVIMGFNTADEIFYEKDFKSLGCDVFVATADASYGTKGFVTDVFYMVDYDYVCACGPEPMLRAVYNVTDCSGQYSFEERMGCGFGACMGCTCKTKYGNKRICKDGPILEKEEIIW